MELPNRQELEEQFAKKFGEVARRHGLEFARLLGEPPKLANIPQEFWDRMAEEMERESYAILLLIFSQSSYFHGWRGKEADLAASGYANLESKRLGQAWSTSSQTMFQKALDRFHRGTAGQQANHPTIDQHRRGNRVLTPGDADYDRIISQVFGPQRAAYNATNETTRTRSAGSEAAVEATFGLNEQDLWVNPRDGATCEICLPLVYQGRSVWTPHAPDGPPPPLSVCHCRCYISYLADRVRDGVDQLFPRWSAEERRRYFEHPETMRRVAI